MRTLTSWMLFPALLLVAAPVHAQIALGARVGSAGGTAGYMVFEGHARARVLDKLHLTTAFEMIGGIWACADSPLENIRCGYDGYSISVGGAYPLFQGRRTLLLIGGNSGAFVRTGTYAGRQYTGSRHAFVRAGIDGEVSVIGPMRLQASLAHRRIFDETYESAFDRNPNYTGLSIGVSILLKDGN